MPRLTWSNTALTDLRRLYDFLLSKDADAAQRAIAKIRRSVKILLEQSAIGRPVEGLTEHYREWPIRFGAAGYVALYRVEGDAITILRVRHMREQGFDDK